MIHFQTYTSIEAEKIVNLWNRCFDGDFPLDVRLWHQNVDNCKRTFADASIVAVLDGHIIGALIGKNPNRISTVFVAPEHRRRGIATELLERAEVAFTGELETTLLVGQDDCHFFPGVPEKAAAADAFFTKHGFMRREAFAADMIRTLDDWSRPDSPLQVARTMKQLNIELRACTQQLIPSLLEHVEANFSDRWLRDTRDRLVLEPDPSEVIVAVQDDSNVVGFCHTYSNRSVVLGPSIAWRSLIGRKYGGLGPIGVAKDFRKIGLGLELLNYSITKVAETGAERMVIDWTELVSFYAKAGFYIWKKYYAYSKSY